MHSIIGIVKITICWIITIFCGVGSLVGTLVFMQRSSVAWIGRNIWGPWLLAVLGCKLNVERNDAIDFSKPHVFFMNHQSAIDVLVAYTVIPADISFVAKKELKWIPFLGWAMQVGGMIFVDRSSPKRAVQGMRLAAEQVAAGTNIIAYPEGTRTQTGALSPFKKGTFVTAIQAGVDMVPIAIDGARDLYGAQGMRVVPGQVNVKFGVPLSTANLSYRNNEHREGLTSQGEKQMSELLEQMRQ